MGPKPTVKKAAGGRKKTTGKKSRPAAAKRTGPALKAAPRSKKGRVGSPPTQPSSTHGSPALGVPPWFAHGARATWTDPDDGTGVWEGALKEPGNFGANNSWYFYVSKEDARKKGKGQPSFSVEIEKGNTPQIRKLG